MSKILMIRHLPAALTFKEKEQLLQHFGAQTIWETNSKHNYIFASFSTLEQATASLSRLHQLKIADRRLVVEYSDENEPKQQSSKQSSEESNVTKHINEFLAKLNSWNPSVDFRQPPLPYLKYKYPDPSVNVLINIIMSMSAHKPLYVQTLHLMNKMCLDNPFTHNIEAQMLFKNMFRELYLDEVCQVDKESVCEEESEISSEEDNKTKQNTSLPIVKRKHLLPQTRKRAAAMLSTATMPRKVAKTKVSQEQVFEEVSVVEPKKISVNVSQDALAKPTEPLVEATGAIGKFQKEDKPDNTQSKQVIETDKPTVSKKELLQNRISYKDMKMLPVFKNYQPGPPSMRLYIKNLAKSVTEQDVKSIYRRYVEDLSEIEQIGFDVRVMQEGRMKGQGFVTFPSIALAEKAITETNGYLLKDKPMVVQFARAANKNID